MDYQCGQRKLKRFINIKIVWIFSIFFLLFLYHLNNKVYADNFADTGGEIANCKLSFTSAFQINSLPQNNNIEISYDSSQIKGEQNNWIQNNKFTSTGTYLFPSASRYPYIASIVQVPPNTNIDVGIFISNFAGHDIHISENSNFYFTKNNLNDGDATKLLSGDFKSLNSSWLAFGNNMNRGGKGFTFGGFDVTGNDINMNGKVIGTFKTIQPINLISRNVMTSYEGVNLILNVNNVIKNISQYDLQEIELKEFDSKDKSIIYDQKYNFNANESKNISYKINLGSDYTLKFQTMPLEIFDPNFHFESITKSGTGIDSFSSFINRNDSPRINAYNNQSVLGDNSNYGEYMNINLIPYSIYSPTQQINLSSDIQIVKTVVQSDDIKSKTLTYSINVVNKGARDDQAFVSDELDKNLEFVSSNGGRFENQKIIWDLGNVGHNITWNLSFIAKVIDVPDMTTISNVATYTSTNQKIDSNRTQTLIHRFKPVLDKQVDKSEATINELLSYTVNYGNTLSGSGQVHLVDILPSDVTFISCSKCDYTNNKVSLTDSLTSFQTKQLAIIVKIIDKPANNTILNLVTLSDDQGNEISSQASTKLILPQITPINSIVTSLTPSIGIKITNSPEIIPLKDQTQLLASTGNGIMIQIILGICLLIVSVIFLIPMRVLKKIFNPIYLLPLFIVIPHIVFATSNYKSDISPFWNGIKVIIDLLRYIAGGVAVLVVVLIGIQKIISLIVPSEHNSTSGKVVSLVIGLAIVIFAPDIIKLIASIFSVSIDLPV